MKFLKMLVGVTAAFTIFGMAHSTRSEQISAVPTAWKFRVVKDEMRGTEDQIATTESDSTLKLGQPYSGGSKVVLTVEKFALFAGSDLQYAVFFSIEPGQISCRRLVYERSDCVVPVKIDDGPVEQLSGQVDEGSSPTRLLMGLSSTYGLKGSIGSTELLSRLRTAKRLTVEVGSYGEGTFQVHFNVEGFPLH